jgi:hypothetical protein
LDAYLESKGEDIGSECYTYRAFGYCRFGLRCRFAGDHSSIIESTVEEKNGDSVQSKVIKIPKDSIDELKMKETEASSQILNVVQKSTLKKSLQRQNDSPKLKAIKEWLEINKKLHNARESYERGRLPFVLLKSFFLIL